MTHINVLIFLKYRSVFVYQYTPFTNFLSPYIIYILQFIYKNYCFLSLSIEDWKTWIDHQFSQKQTPIAIQSLYTTFPTFKFINSSIYKFNQRAYSFYFRKFCKFFQSTMFIQFYSTILFKTWNLLFKFYVIIQLLLSSSKHFVFRFPFYSIPSPSRNFEIL